MLGAGLQFGSVRVEDRFYVPVKERKSQSLKHNQQQQQQGPSRFLLLLVSKVFFFFFSPQSTENKIHIREDRIVIFSCLQLTLELNFLMYQKKTKKDLEL
uniref:Uncharacterized protein n=1 Tax=Rhizophora mucronata TaxID=61149 RepID=A0A2P2QYS7_RHIMU